MVPAALGLSQYLSLMVLESPRRICVSLPMDFASRVSVVDTHGLTCPYNCWAYLSHSLHMLLTDKERK